MTTETRARLGLGTAQFGMAYGTFNRDGRPSNQEIADILSHARRIGMSMLDTASTYGSSEEVLGEVMQDVDSFRIVTKTPALNVCSNSREAREILLQAFAQSLERLRRKAVHGLLVHDCEDLLGENGPAIFDTLQELKELGQVKRIGVSVYTLHQIETLMERYPLDLVQLPLNVFDQRLVASGALHHLKQAGVEVHARSVFLQGLLLVDPASLPDFFAPVRPRLARFHMEATLRGLLPVQAALQFVMQQKAVDVALVGVDSLRQLKQITTMAEHTSLDYSAYRVDEAEILNPAMWQVAGGGVR